MRLGPWFDWCLVALGFVALTLGVTFLIAVPRRRRPLLETR
jgi:hypothetical protein